MIHKHLILIFTSFIQVASHSTIDQMCSKFQDSGLT